MEINRCAGCEQEAKAYPCPHCGFDTAKNPMPEYALPYDTILHGRYLVGKILGQGGFGITYVAYDLALERKVAVKEFFPSGQVSRNADVSLGLQWYSSEQSQKMRSRGMDAFLREARKMARLEEIPEIVKVRDTFCENQTAYIVMDFVEGETLKKRLSSRGTLSWQEARELFLPVAAAMERAHQAGLIHRDLSPDNLMVQPGGRVKILDLGAAKDFIDNGGASSTLVVKAGFSPIEQYGQFHELGPWTDVYALAVTICYGLTGVLPPSATDRVECDGMNWNLLLQKKVPQEVVLALRSAMAVSPKNRTRSMAEFGRQLMERANTPKRKRRKWMLAGACGCLAAAIGCAMLMGSPWKKAGAEPNPPLKISAPPAPTWETVLPTAAPTLPVETDAAQPTEHLLTKDAAAVGSVILFGSYEQDGDIGNGKEPVEWVVLDYDMAGQKSLVISKYILDFAPFQSRQKDVSSFPTWAKSEIRSWLNETFLNEVFSLQEQKRILLTELETTDFAGVDGGLDTTDRIFLLSRGEANRLFEQNEERAADLTPYAQTLAQREKISVSNRSTWWWLRSPGMYDFDAASVGADGIVHSGRDVASTYGVRPAFWIDLHGISN